MLTSNIAESLGIRMSGSPGPAVYGYVRVCPGLSAYAWVRPPAYIVLSIDSVLLPACCPDMGTFYHLLRLLEKDPDVISCLSLTTLVRFIILATNLKDDIILVLQSAAAPISEPPAVLSPAFNAFLAIGTRDWNPR